MSEWMRLQSTRHQVAIVGSVRDAQTGQVISGAEVNLRQGPAEFGRWLNLKAIQHGDSLRRQGFVALNSTLSLVLDRTGMHLVTQTLRDGYFYFIDLPSGVYRLSVSLPNAGTRYGTREIENLTVTERDGNIQRAIVDVTLPPTGIKGRIVSSDAHPIGMAKLQIEGSNLIAFSDRNGDFLVTGLEVWQSPSQPAVPRPVVTVSAQGYQSATSGVWLTLGEVNPLAITLTRKKPT